MLNVLIVDDVKEMRDLLSKILKTEGHTCCEAETGPQAIRVLKIIKK